MSGMFMTINGFLQDDPQTGNNFFARLRCKQKFQKQGEQARSSFLTVKAFSGTAELLAGKNLSKGDFIVAEVEFRNGEKKQDGSGYYPDYFQILNVIYAGPYGNSDEQGGGQQTSGAQQGGARQSNYQQGGGGQQQPARQQQRTPAFSDTNAPF